MNKWLLIFKKRLHIFKLFKILPKGLYALINNSSYSKLLLFMNVTSWHDPGHNFIVKIGTENTLQTEESLTQTTV